jgi:hypothetical protein
MEDFITAEMRSGASESSISLNASVVMERGRTSLCIETDRDSDRDGCMS